MVKEIKGTKFSIKVVPESNRENYTTDLEKDMDFRAKQAVKAAVSKAEVCKKPVAKYDIATKTAYLQYPDGSRVNVHVG